MSDDQAQARACLQDLHASEQDQPRSGGTLARCECEHVKHGAHGCYQARNELPQRVRTTWGTYLLCSACRADGCMRPEGALL